MRLGTFRLPCRYGRSIHSVSKASNDTSDYELGQSERSSHDKSTNNHDSGSYKDCSSPTELITKPDGSNGSAEATKIVGCHRNGLNGRSVDFIFLRCDTHCLEVGPIVVDLRELFDLIDY